MAADNTYSRLVAWLKILLPLLALAVLSSIFLVSRTIDPNDAIPYAQVDVDARIRDPRLTKPVFSGLTSDGASVTITAAEMRPEPGRTDKGNAQYLIGHMDTPDGARTDIVAATGVMDTVAQRLDLSGGVVVTSSSGYRVTSPDMTGSLARTDIHATGGVKADGPLGVITSDTMRLTLDEGSGAYLLVFNDNVRLIYTPQN